MGGADEEASDEEVEEVGGGRRPNSNLVSARMTPLDSACAAAVAAKEEARYDQLLNQL